MQSLVLCSLSLCRARREERTNKSSSLVREGKRQFQTLLGSLNDIHHRISSLEQQFVTTTDCNRRPEALFSFVFSAVTLHVIPSPIIKDNPAVSATTEHSLWEPPAVFFLWSEQLFYAQLFSSFPSVLCMKRSKREEETWEWETLSFLLCWSCAWSLCVWQNH